MEQILQLELFEREQIKIDKPIRLIELFSGYGSQAMAMRNIGAQFERWFVCEFDEFAVRSYNAVHGTSFRRTDIRDVHGSDLNITDKDRYCYLMFYSFPCTDLSVAGKMAGMAKNSGTRSGLLWEVERILLELKESDALPDILCCENVPQIVSEKNRPDFLEWIKSLYGMGYSSTYRILNARDFGIPQNRERFFMLSFLGDYSYQFPDSVPLRYIIRDVLEDSVDEKYYIRSEKAERLIQTAAKKGTVRNDCDFEMEGNFNQRGKVHGGESICRTIIGGSRGNEPKVFVDLSTDNPKERTISNCITSREKRGISSRKSIGGGVLVKKPVVIDIYNRRKIDGDVCGTITAGVAKAGSGTFGFLSSGKTDREKKADEKRFFRQALEAFEKNECVPGDTVNGYNRTVNRSGLCPTLTTRPEGFKTAVLPVTADYRIRKLTPKECFRLMAVSDEDADKMLAVNSNSQCYKQAGNSIVVSVLEALFRNLNIRGVEIWSEVKDSYDPYRKAEAQE